jgi:hypothetical protein
MPGRAAAATHRLPAAPRSWRPPPAAPAPLSPESCYWRAVRAMPQAPRPNLREERAHLRRRHEGLPLPPHRPLRESVRESVGEITATPPPPSPTPRRDGVTAGRRGGSVTPTRTRRASFSAMRAWETSRASCHIHMPVSRGCLCTLGFWLARARPRWNSSQNTPVHGWRAAPYGLDLLAHEPVPGDLRRGLLPAGTLPGRPAQPPGTHLPRKPPTLP